MVNFLFLFAVGLFGQDAKSAPKVDPIENQVDKVVQKSVSLSLQKAVLLALEHNFDLEIARFTPLINKESIRSAESPFDYILESSAKYTDTEYESYGVFGATSSTSSLAEMGLSLSKTIPFGATFTFGYNISDTNSSNSSFFGTSSSDHWTQSLSLTATLPLLKGFGTDYQTSSILLARNTEKSSLYDFEATLTEVIYSIHQAYWNLVYAMKNQSVNEESLSVAEKLRDETDRKLKAGVVIRLELTQAESGVANRQEGIITAQANVLNAIDRLKLQVNPGLLDQKDLFVPSDSPEGVQESFNQENAVEQAYALALKHRPEYLKYRYSLDSQDMMVHTAESDLLPTLTLSGYTNFSDPPNSLNSLSESFYDIFDNQEYQAALSFSYALGQSSARAAYNQALLNKRILLLQRRKEERTILVEVREAVRRIVTQEKVIEATKKALKLAQDQFEAEMNRKQRQVSTTFNVLNMQKEVTVAQANEIKARIDYQMALINLRKVTGTLLIDMGIKLEEMFVPQSE